MTAWGNAFGRHLGLGLLAAGGVGLVEGAVALAALERADPSAWLGPVLAAAVMAPAGVLVGAGGFVFVTAGLGPLRAAGRAVPADVRLPIGLATAALAAAMAWAGGRYMRFAGELQDPAFARDLAVFCVALSSAALPVVALAIAKGLSRVQRALPRAPAGWRARAVVAGEALAFVASAALLTAFVREHEALLGPLFALPYGCLLAVVLGALARSRRGLFSGRRAVRAIAVTALVAFALAAVGLSALRGADAVVRQTLGPSRVSALLERIADVDRDGQAGLFGGRDCAPLDRKRGPFAVDVPANGVDEDCSGRDARRRAAGARPAGEPLPAELVARRNVVLIVVDAMRADRLGLGAPRSLTPVLDQLATRSVVFTEAFSQSSTTRIAFPSFLSGKDPTSLTWVRKRGWLQSAGAEPLLSELLQRAGYSTGLVINGWIRDRLTQIQRGYEIVLSNREAGSARVAPQLNGPSSTARAIEFIELALLENKPFFLTLYYEGPHAPYDDPTPYGVAPRGTRPIDRYDAEVRYTDRQIGHVLEHLSVQPETAANTIVIVTADHGEEFGEHGGAQHSRQCYRESTHVPLIVHAPGLPPAIVRTRVALTNIAPTVLALVGAPLPAALDGVNLLAADPARHAEAVDRSVSCAYFDDKNPNRTRVQAVRDRGLLYIERLSGGSRELYDTAADRGERTNLAREPARVAVIDRLKRQLRPLQIRD
jgi:arylsulfatase A-like enzyme